MDEVKLIEGEDSPWYCPNCGKAANAEIKGERRIVICKMCGSFQVIMDLFTGRDRRTL